MTEKEKMLSGMLYDGTDGELQRDRAEILDLVYDYNLTREREQEKRATLLDKMLGGHGSYTRMYPPVHFDYGKNTFVGENFFSNYNLTVLDCGKVTIGDNVYIGPNVTFATPMHAMNAEERRLKRREDGSLYDLEYALPITVGNDVWIASNATICGGVTVGEGAVIGAGSVVTHDVPPYTLCAGNPCREIRKLK